MQAFNRPSDIRKSAASLQVQGQALLPGAAMFEMASSAAATLLPPVGSIAAAAVPALLHVTIPQPLPLSAAAGKAGGSTWALSAVLSVVVDAASGRLTVASQQAAGATQRVHLAASSGCVLAPAAVHAAGQASQQAPLPALVARPAAAEVGAAVADVLQVPGDQSGQYRVHPAALDCTTQASTSSIKPCSGTHCCPECSH